MEQRDPESGAVADLAAAPAEPGDIELAAAAAIAEAEQTGAVDGAGGSLPGGHPAAPAPAFDDPSGTSRGPSHGPRRWIVVAAVALTAVALATTAAAVAMRGPGHTDTTVGAEQPTTGVPNPGTSTDTGTTSTAGDASDTTSQSGAATTTTSSATTPSPSKRTTPPPTSNSRPTTPVGSNETDCENTSHETPQDAAQKFNGMTRGTQQAFLAAQAAAKEAGITPFVLNSGYRSAAYQQRIFDCWVAQLGSAQAARQYALPPNQSAHVAGYAMDIAPQSAASWLESTAGKYGLCRRYVDEPWHFEYQSYYRTKGCPALLPQP